MKIASWNVNSVRMRLDHIKHYLEEHPVDFLCLQETKVVDELFPQGDIQSLGYCSFFSGQKSYNGVAILTKHTNATLLANCLDESDPQKRFLAIVWNDVLIVNIYAPNGQSLDSPKYQYKIQWFTYLIEFLKRAQTQYSRIILTGDFNIIPTDKDAYDPLVWKDCILCSEKERALLDEIKAIGLVDSLRTFNQDSNVFSWWDYRQNAFRRKMGLRIDLLLASEKMMCDCKQSVVIQTPREWEKPSDHAPIMADFCYPH